MIDFDLKHAHEEYHPIIVETYESLLERYPATPLRKVRVYPTESASNCSRCLNRSLGDAAQTGEIRLNAYWFGLPPSVLQAAGTMDDFVPGFPELRWHGGIEQPAGVLHHEGMHVVLCGLGPEAKAFAHLMWLEATHNPAIAVSGYAVFGGDAKGSEWWAETGACHEVGGRHHNEQVEELGRFLAHVR